MPVNHYHSILVFGGKVFTCGRNLDGQLGQGECDETRTKLCHVDIPVKITAVAAGNAFQSLAIGLDGSLWCWGGNRQGQLGLGSENAAFNRPEKLTHPSHFVNCSAGANYSIALDSEGNVWLTGLLGKIDSRTFVKMDLHNIKQISGGSAFFIALDDHGKLWIYGDLSQIIENDSVPMMIESSVEFRQISAGFYHALAVDSQGNVWGLGQDLPGQIGISLRLKLKQVETKESMVSVQCGGYYSMMINSSKQVWLVGNSSFMQILKGNPLDHSTQIIPQLEDMEIFAGANHVICVSRQGHLYSCGSNAYGKFIFLH
jgi:alpha-tubulin suppressor-like RCC1 family protein